MDIDWSKADNAERKALFDVAKAVAKDCNIPLPQFLNTALGLPSDHDWGDMANLRKGKLARDKSQKLYEYLAEQYYRQAQDDNEGLFPYRIIRDVEAYITEAAHKGRLHIVPMTGELGLVKRKSQYLPPDAEMKLGEAFCLELDALKPGYAVAFQGYKGKWHAFPLHGDAQACRITEGVQHLPQMADGQLDPLYEGQDMDQHCFLILTSPNRNHLMNGGELPERLDRCDLYAVRVRFTAT